MSVSNFIYEMKKYGNQAERSCILVNNRLVKQISLSRGFMPEIAVVRNCLFAVIQKPL